MYRGFDKLVETSAIFSKFVYYSIQWSGEISGFLYALFIWLFALFWPAFIGSFLGYGVMRLVRHLTRDESEPDFPL